MNTKDKGIFGTFIVMLEANRRGYTVLQPHGDNKRYDLVFEKDGIFQRVQVKTIEPSDERIRLNMNTVIHNKDKTTNTKYRRVKYTASQIDLFAIVDPVSEDVFIVPFADVEHISSEKTFHKTELYEKYHSWV